MAKYSVCLSTMAKMCRVVEVEASNPEEAEELAYKEAPQGANDGFELTDQWYEIETNWIQDEHGNEISVIDEAV